MHHLAQLKQLHSVESARVENRTDLDKLIVDLETDGTIDPERAIKYAGQFSEPAQYLYKFDKSSEQKKEEKKFLLIQLCLDLWMSSN